MAPDEQDDSDATDPDNGPVPHVASTQAPATGFEPRVRALEEKFAGLAASVETRRLVVRDGSGDACLVAEVVGGRAELRLSTGGTGSRDQSSSPSVLVFASPGSDEFGSLLGIQLWADGNVVAALEACEEHAGGPSRWTPTVHLDR